MKNRSNIFSFSKPTLFGLCLASLFSLQCHDSPGKVRIGDQRKTIVAGAVSGVGEMTPQETLASQDPLAFLYGCRDRYDDQVVDYRCYFTKQERVNDELLPEQGIDVQFRQQPYSVDMSWVKNERRAKRATFVAGRFHEDGQDQAVFVPSGVLGALLPSGVRRSIHGPEAKSESRKTIDQFGFRNSLDLIIKFCELAKGHPEYELRYMGKGRLNERPCFVFERHLPYTGVDGDFPDRVLEVYIDEEWLVPTGCIAYSDEAKDMLLGRYVHSDVTFNVGLTDVDF